MLRSNSSSPSHFRYFNLIVGLAVICSATVAGANEDYDKACQQAAQLADQLQSYQLKATITMANQIADAEETPPVSASMVSAARWPDLLVNRQSGDMAPIDLGNSPQQSWFYFGLMKAAYIGEPLPLSRNLTDAGILELSAKHIYNFYNGISQFLLTPDLDIAPDTGHETLVVNGHEVPCLVFTALAAPANQQHKDFIDGGQVIFYDPESGLVLKNEQTSFYESAGKEVERTTIFVLTEFTVNAGVDEELFSFSAPPKIRVVNQLDRLTNPDSMTGEAAPDITFTDLEGNKFNLADLRGQPVFIDFWATWCGPCKMEMPHIEKLYQEMGESGKIKIIAASSEDKHSVQRFLARNPYSFKVVMVASEDARRQYNTNSIPAGFVIDAEGVIRAHMVGAQSEAQLREAFAKAGVK